MWLCTWRLDQRRLAPIPTSYWVTVTFEHLISRSLAIGDQGATTIVPVDARRCERVHQCLLKKLEIIWCRIGTQHVSVIGEPHR